MYFQPCKIMGQTDYLFPQLVFLAGFLPPTVSQKPINLGCTNAEADHNTLEKGKFCIFMIRFFCMYVCRYMGVSSNDGTPISHPKMIISSRKIHGCWVPLFLETPIYVYMIYMIIWMCDVPFWSCVLASRVQTKISDCLTQKNGRFGGKRQISCHW